MLPPVSTENLQADARLLPRPDTPGQSSALLLRIVIWRLKLILNLFPISKPWQKRQVIIAGIATYF
jgi:hypothetical protein